MKNRKWLLGIAVLIVAICTFVFVACDEPTVDGTPTFTISFDTQGGNEISPITVGNGVEIALPANPFKDGFVFGGWFLDEACLTELADLNTITGDMVLYAKWVEDDGQVVSPTTYKIDFIVDDNLYASIEVASGGVINIPATPTKANNSFDGWYMEDELINEFSVNQVVSQNITLYAKWKDNEVSTIDSEVNSSSNNEIAYVETGLEFTLNDDGESYSVTGIGTFEGTELVIPSVYSDGKSVTSIGNYAFQDCTGLTSVTIGGGVTSIGDAAFQTCTGLTNITIPNSVTSIGNGAFYHCTGLTSIIIPDSVTSIGKSAVGNCYGLESITIPFVGATKDEINNSHFGYIFGASIYTAIGSYLPSSLKTVVITGGTRIMGNAFYKCSRLISITIPDSVGSIGYSAFEDCYDLANITIPDSVGLIGSDAFTDTAWYDNQPDGLIYVGKVAYEYKGSMHSGTSIEIKDEIESISDRAFYNCTGLTSITIPDSVRTIGSDAFNGCTGLTSITMGNGVQYIYNDAFNGCSGLAAVYITDVAKWCEIHFGTKYSNPLEYAHYLYLNGERPSGSIDIPQGKIPSYTFYDCKGLTGVSIGKVTSIGDYVFYGCTNHAVINVADDNSTYASVNNILYNKAKTSILYVPKAIKGEIVVPESVTSISNGIFDGCVGLEKITGSIDNVSVIVKQAMPTACEIIVTLGDNILESTFKNCTGLTKVTLPNTIKNIGKDAFNGCTNLADIVIPDSIVSVHYDAFDNTAWYDNQPKGLIYVGKVAYEYKGSMYSGTPIEIKDEIVSISDYAFFRCTGLYSITIPNTVKYVGDYAFYNCTSLESIVFEENSKVESIGDYAFYNCKCLQTLTIPDSVVSIGEDAFYGASSLSEVTLGSGLKTIGNGAFRGCSGIKSVSISNGVESIGDCAFWNCYNIAEIHFKGAVNDWLRISLGLYWDSSVGSATERGSYVVYCTDGHINK